MRSTWLQKLILGAVGLFLAVYVGVQIYQYVQRLYQTETIYPYTITESVKVSGIVLRRETVLEERVDGVAAYTVEDGTKVSTGMQLAEIYRSEQEADDIYQLRSLSAQKEQLLRAQDPGKTTYAHTDVLNKQIFSELSGLMRQVDSGELLGLEEASEKLLLLMNTKQIATGKCENFDTACSAIEAQEAYYAARPRKDPRVVTAEGAGYFIRTLDGFEGLVDMDKLHELSPTDLAKLQMRPAKPQPAKLGKLMTDHVWYYATVVPLDDQDNFREGMSVTLNFNITGVEPVPAYISEVHADKEAGKLVVIYESSYINSALVNLRVTQAEVMFKNITGLRIDSKAVRYQGLQRGVYVIRGEFMQFRPVDVIHEGNGFLLCALTDPALPEYAQNLQQYDEVIVEGTDLYDGKPAK